MVGMANKVLKAVAETCKVKIEYNSVQQGMIKVNQTATGPKSLELATVQAQEGICKLGNKIMLGLSDTKRHVQIQLSRHSRVAYVESKIADSTLVTANNMPLFLRHAPRNLAAGGRMGCQRLRFHRGQVNAPKV